MSEIQPVAPLSPATQPEKTLNVLKISNDLVEVAEAPFDGTRPYAAYAAYLLKLVNALGILIYEIKPDRKMELIEQLWKDKNWAENFKAKAEVQNPIQEGSTRLEVNVSETEHEGKKVFAVTVPVIHEGKLRSFICAFLRADDKSDLSPFIIILQAATGFLNYLYKRKDQSTESWALEQTSALVEIMSNAAGATDFKEAARLMANGMVRHLGCFRVCVGIMKRKEMTLVAISGVENFDTRGTSTLVLQSAMREAYHKKEDVEWPREGDPVDLSEMAHHELQRLLDLDKVISIPLPNHDGKPFAVMTLLWKKGTTPDEHVTRFLDTARPHLGSQIELLKKAEPLPPVKTWKKTWGRMTKDKRTATISATVFLILLLCWQFSYRVGTKAYVQPDTKRILAAPFDGVLKKTLVEPGQIVEEDQALATMDEKEMAWKQAELMAARDKALTQRDKAMSDDSTQSAISQMAQYDAESFAMELKSIENKMQNLEIRAPIAGYVILGDLKRSEGIPVSKGQILFEISPLDRMVVQLEVDSSDIPHVKEGQRVSVKIESFPGQKFWGKIERINPQSEVRNGKNVFLAEASLPNVNKETGLRPGMKGKAVIIADTKSLFWIIFHRLWEFFQVFLFW